LMTYQLLQNIYTENNPVNKYKFLHKHMSEFIRASKVKKQKQKPTTHKGLHHNANNIVDYSFSAKKCNCNNGKYVLADNGHILCEDGAKILMHNCKFCHESMWICSACATSKNVYTKSKHAHRHKGIITKLRLRH